MDGAAQPVERFGRLAVEGEVGGPGLVCLYNTRMHFYARATHDQDAGKVLGEHRYGAGMGFYGALALGAAALPSSGAAFVTW